MKKAMLVAVLEGDHVARFYDDVETAINDADIIMTSLGGCAEVYERQEATEENDFDNSYQMVYCG